MKSILYALLNNYNEEIMCIVIALMFLIWLKAITVGSNFSIISYIRYKNDYKLWYSRRQKYIPPHKRSHFSKKKK